MERYICLHGHFSVFEREEQRVEEAGPAGLLLGRARFSSETTLESTRRPW